MNKAPGYLVLIKSSEGLEEQRGENRQEIVRKNVEAITSNFDALFAQLTADGVLEGIVIYTKMPFVSLLSIDGPKDKIERLEQYLKESGIGHLCENFEMEAIGLMEDFAG